VEVPKGDQEFSESIACDEGRKLMKMGCSENRVACLSMLQTIADAGNVSAFE
jgi:hypothetical protein